MHKFIFYSLVLATVGLGFWGVYEEPERLGIWLEKVRGPILKRGEWEFLAKGSEKSEFVALLDEVTLHAEGQEEGGKVLVQAYLQMDSSQSTVEVQNRRKELSDGVLRVLGQMRWEELRHKSGREMLKNTSEISHESCALPWQGQAGVFTPVFINSVNF